MFIASISGIRFTTDEPFIKIQSYVAAFAKKHKGLIVLGRDSRPSGKAISTMVMQTFRAAGCRVLNCGILPTPTLTMYLVKHKARGGVMITASHNPAEWNGLKFFGPDGLYLAYVPY